MTLTELLKLDIDPSDPANRDPEFIRTIALPARPPPAPLPPLNQVRGLVLDDEPDARVVLLPAQLSRASSAGGRAPPSRR